MKRLLIIIFISMAISACNGSSENKEQVKYEKTKESLKETEMKTPLSFLSIQGKSKRNFIGQSVIKADVRNAASVVSYKNVRIKALYYKGNELVTNHEDVIEKSIAPGDTYAFRSKYFTPKGTDSIALSIMSAEVATPAKE